MWANSANLLCPYDHDPDAGNLAGASLLPPGLFPPTLKGTTMRLLAVAAFCLIANAASVAAGSAVPLTKTYKKSSSPLVLVIRLELPMVCR
jgi:hypothetical protein